MDSLIDSPPYPLANTNPTQLYNYLLELYEWTANQVDWANMQAVELNAPENPFIPALGPFPGEDARGYLQLSVPDMYLSWQAARAIREKYDQIVRNYEEEDSWNSKPGIFHRINIVKSAALLMSMCFLDTEKREAKTAEILSKERKRFIKILKEQLGDLSNLFNEDGTNDKDIDSLFDGEIDE